MTDLRELLREAACELEHASRGVIDETYCGDLHRRIDAALAQPPDAKPVGWMCEKPNDRSPTEWPAMQCSQFARGAFPVYRAPQPPAGNSDAIPREIHERLIAEMKADHAHEYEQHCQQAADDAKKIAEKDAEIARLKLALKIARDPDDEPSAGMIEPLSEIDVACQDLARAMQGRVDHAVNRAEAAERALAKARTLIASFGTARDFTDAEIDQMIEHAPPSNAQIRDPIEHERDE
jgi:hypothetical protein